MPSLHLSQPQCMPCRSVCHVDSILANYTLELLRLVPDGSQCVCAQTPAQMCISQVWYY